MFAFGRCAPFGALLALGLLAACTSNQQSTRQAPASPGSFPDAAALAGDGGNDGSNWLLQRPTVSTVVIGARNEEQLRQNLGAVGWNLTPEQVARLDAASAVKPIYPK